MSAVDDDESPDAEVNGGEFSELRIVVRKQMLVRLGA